MSEDEYTAFWAKSAQTEARWLDYLNNVVLQQGIDLPYWNLSFLTHSKFEPHAFVLIVDLFYTEPASPDKWREVVHF